VYIAHSRSFDYKNELYKPIREDSDLCAYSIHLPHELENSNTNPRSFYKNMDVVIAECSYPSTGMGMELGWAYDDGKPIYCIHKKGSKVTESLKSVTTEFHEYEGKEDMVQLIKTILQYENAKQEQPNGFGFHSHK
jgi:nucleoside 2-deoxyribosyltransferase